MDFHYADWWEQIFGKLIVDKMVLGKNYTVMCHFVTKAYFALYKTCKMFL